MIVSLKKQLGIVEKENEDLEKDESTTRFTVAELKEILAERNELRNRIHDLEEELIGCRPVTSDEREKINDQDFKDEDPPVQGEVQ